MTANAAPNAPAPIPEGQARVLLEIEDRAVAGGRPLLLLRDGRGFHCLGHALGQEVKPLSNWVEPQAALDVALRVLGGEKTAMTDPRALRGLAIALVGLECWFEEARANMAAAPATSAGASASLAPKSGAGGQK